MLNIPYKPIEGYPNYLVTECGRVWSKNREKFVVIWKNRKGYSLVNLNKNGKCKGYAVSRLVMLSISSPISDKYQVNHINGDKSDNSRDNLEWCTPSENAKHAYHTGLACNKGSNHPGAKLTGEEVRYIRASKASNIDLGKEFSMCRTSIGNIRRRKTWAHID